MQAVLPLSPGFSVLICAATDPTCGAGLLADSLTLHAGGVHPFGIVTAVTAQDTTGVHAVYPVSDEIFQHQIEVLLADVKPGAVKVGVLASTGQVKYLAQAITFLRRNYPDLPVVLDPVLASGRGDSLMGKAVVEALTAYLIPLTTLLTPNYNELYSLLGLPASTCVEKAIETYFLQPWASSFLLVKGSHAPTENVQHKLYGRSGVEQITLWPRLPGEYHGSGCTLASAITGYLVKGHTLPEAVWEAQNQTWGMLEKAYSVGKGQLIPNRFNCEKQGDGHEQMG